MIRGDRERTRKGTIRVRRGGDEIGRKTFNGSESKRGKGKTKR